MDFYVIPPVNHLRLMDEGKGNRYFCLAQLYKKHPHYREFFKQKVRDGAWVTLDNGAGDHDIISSNELVSITFDLHPSEVIPPDILFNGIQTIRNLEEFINVVQNRERVQFVEKSKIQFFGCPQGRNEQEWLFVYEYMLTHPAVTTIGLSKIAVPKAFLNAEGDKMIKEARWIAYHKLKAQGLIQKPIHLLGLGDPTELILYKNDPMIRSNDSCNAVWSGMNRIDWNHNNFERIPTPKDYFNRTIDCFELGIVHCNIDWLKAVLG